MKKITLLWNRPKEIFWDVDWIEYLFRNIPHDSVENDSEHSLYFDRCVIVDTIQWAPHHDEYINNMNAKGYQYALVHLSDEICSAPVHTYDRAKFVLRNYLRSGLPKNVAYFPLCYNNGVADLTENPPANERKNTWAFIGQRWDNTREAMKAAMTIVPNGMLHVTLPDGANRMSPRDMSKIYRDTIFVPSPRGWFIIDSCRVSESLESGCIPIVDADQYWADLYGEVPPFIQVSDWNQAPAIVNRLLKNPKELEELRLRCYNWWCAVKDRTTQQVENLVNQAFNS